MQFAQNPDCLDDPGDTSKLTSVGALVFSFSRDGVDAYNPSSLVVLIRAFQNKSSGTSIIFVRAVADGDSGALLDGGAEGLTVVFDQNFLDGSLVEFVSVGLDVFEVVLTNGSGACTWSGNSCACTFMHYKLTLSNYRGKIKSFRGF